VQLHTVAVEFQLVRPAFARRRRCSELRQGTSTTYRAWNLGGKGRSALRSALLQPLLREIGSICALMLSPSVISYDSMPRPDNTT